MAVWYRTSMFLSLDLGLSQYIKTIITDYMYMPSNMQKIYFYLKCYHLRLLKHVIPEEKPSHTDILRITLPDNSHLVTKQHKYTCVLLI